MVWGCWPFLSFLSSEVCPAAGGQARGWRSVPNAGGEECTFALEDCAYRGYACVPVGDTLSQEATRFGTDGHGVSFSLPVAIISPACWVLISLPGPLPALGFW